MTHETFEEWFDAFYEYLSIKLGYSGPVDKDSLRELWEQGDDPRHSASDFYKEMME